MAGPLLSRCLLVPGLLLVLGATGCARSLDMASAYDAKRPAATIPYAGVREVTRQYPDYNAITADILREPPAPGKKGRSP
jgi:hypothetical protein